MSISKNVFSVARLSALLFPLCALLVVPLGADNKPTTRPGYYRFPAIHGDTVIFTAEGDLWSVGAEGGAARRLTTGTGMESDAAISPDGATVAFTGEYGRSARRVHHAHRGGAPPAPHLGW